MQTERLNQQRDVNTVFVMKLKCVDFWCWRSSILPDCQRDKNLSVYPITGSFAPGTCREDHGAGTLCTCSDIEMLLKDPVS